MKKRMGIAAGALAGLLLAEAGRAVEGEAMGQVLAGDGDEMVDVNKIQVSQRADAHEKKAAAELSAYIKAICGRELPVVSFAGGASEQGSIYIGQAAVEAGLLQTRDLGALAPDGYKLVSLAGVIAVAGFRGAGTLHGVYGFLEKLGVRFFAPDCVNVPRNPALSVPEFKFEARPAFDFRGGYWAGGKPEQGFTPNEDSPPASLVDEKSGAGWDHTASYQLPKYLYGDSHPEFYAKDEKGKPKKFGRLYDVQLCLAHPEVREIAAGRILDWIDKQPQGKYFCVTQGDGGAWCQCPKCRALDPRPGAKDEHGWYYAELSDRLLDYVNFIAGKVAEKYPDKIILTLAYTPATQPPPRKIKPAPNVKVMFCPYPTPGGAMCNSHDLFCPKNTGALEDLKGWLAWCPDNVYIYDYPCGYNRPSEPLGSLYAMAAKIKFYHFNGIRGIFFCGGPRLFGELFNYVMGRLLWRSDLDVDALIDEFLPAYYGAAAPYMREYLNLLYNRVDDHAAPFHTHCEEPNPGLVTPKFAAKAYELFEKARLAARDDDGILARVKREELYGVLWADLNENYSGPLVKRGRIDKARLAKFRKLVETSTELRITNFVRRDGGKDWIVGNFGLPIATEVWYQDPLVRKLARGKLSKADLAAVELASRQKDIPGGIELRLTAFSGGAGPESYSHNCPRRTAVWITPQGTKTSGMAAVFELKRAPKRAWLELDALDDDKPGVARIALKINGKRIFSGENGAKEDDWTTLRFEVPAKLLKRGRNTLDLGNLERGENPHVKWFMISAARVVFD